ncbi:response regulator [Rhodopila sp.]|uniref:response regulator n=1 Tax=Rhodopila sp. TaxID=2480087 RepID=UPI003D1196D0
MAHDKPGRLTGKRILIVEDEMLVAFLIEEFLFDFGCSTVGPCGDVATALEAVRTEAFDLAVLDVNLAGEKVYPVAELLAERQIPFLFLSGYGEEAIPAGHDDWRVCAKPFTSDNLKKEMSAALTAPAH